jgi:hypothetical protein
LTGRVEMEASVKLEDVGVRVLFADGLVGSGI